MLADQLDYVVGVDPHRDVHALAVVEVRTGVVVFEAMVAADAGGYKCSLATTWVKKLAAKTLPGTKQNTHFPVTGPAGFTCEASPDSKGHAFTGSCEKLVKAGAEKLGFDWTSSFI